ncbi:MAG TPA: hypothetical protein DCF68_00265, partial [Cyanothece sp. UBA12306]|nr:hypothetical protein [Cyanothece sp. UBA12306]
FYEGQTSSWISLNDTLPQAPDLQEGDQYQLMFVTKDVISAVERSDDTETYNNFAQAQAELNPDQTLTDRGVTYQAFASFSTDFDTDGVTPLVTGATANIPITAPVFLVDGTFIGNANQLCNGDTSNSNFINKDQFGNQRGGTPWTGTNRSCGIAGNNNFLGAFRDNQEVPTTSFIGSTGQLLGEWVGLSETLVFDPGDGDGGGPQGEIFRPIFALSTPITVGDDGNGNNNPAPPFNPGNGLGPIAPAITVPEPSALIGLFALGIMGAVSRGKKSKK